MITFGFHNRKIGYTSQRHDSRLEGINTSVMPSQHVLILKPSLTCGDISQLKFLMEK